MWFLGRLEDEVACLGSERRHVSEHVAELKQSPTRGVICNETSTSQYALYILFK